MVEWRFHCLPATAGHAARGAGHRPAHSPLRTHTRARVETRNSPAVFTPHLSHHVRSDSALPELSGRAACMAGQAARLRRNEFGLPTCTGTSATTCSTRTNYGEPPCWMLRHCPCSLHLTTSHWQALGHAARFAATRRSRQKRTTHCIHQKSCMRTNRCEHLADCDCIALAHCTLLLLC